jgi:hypothetical protein
MIRDRDSIYGNEVRVRIASLGMQEVLTAPQGPWQNPYAERLIGSIRRECLHHLVILNGRHLYQDLLSSLGGVASIDLTLPSGRWSSPFELCHKPARQISARLQAGDR